MNEPAIFKCRLIETILENALSILFLFENAYIKPIKNISGRD
jgi:hypothetical protein